MVSARTEKTKQSVNGEEVREEFDERVRVGKEGLNVGLLEQARSQSIVVNALKRVQGLAGEQSLFS